MDNAAGRHHGRTIRRGNGRIVMLEIIESDDTCISCRDRKSQAKKIKINRNGSGKKGENIISFALCDKCLSILAREFRSYE